MTKVARWVVVTAFALALPAAPALAGPIVDAGGGLTLVGAEFTVAVSITDVTALFGNEFSLAYDQAIVEVVDVTEGTFLSGVAPLTFFIHAAPAAGTVGFVANTILGGSPGATGAGTLADLHLRGVAPGVSPLTLSGVQLVDPLNTLIVGVTMADGSVTVSATPVPDGGMTLTLLGCALVGLGALRRRFRA